MRACSRFDPADYRPLTIGTTRVGWLKPDLARRLVDFPDAFERAGDGVAFAARLDSAENRTAALAETCERLAEAGDLKPARGEVYPVARTWGAPLALVDRAWVPALGLRAWGLHVNGIVTGPDGLRLWIGRRARDRAMAPGKLDNLVAGGQPHGLSFTENLVKEAAEEADLPEALALSARPVGAVTYVGERPDGLRDDVLFCYDLDLPPDFVPRNTDGEVEEFELRPAANVLAQVRETDDFKFNVSLVLIDFAIRHGLIGPDAPDYEALCRGLRGGA